MVVVGLDDLFAVPSDLEGNIQDGGDTESREGGQIRGVVLGAKVEMWKDANGFSGVG